MLLHKTLLSLHRENVNEIFSAFLTEMTITSEQTAFSVQMIVLLFL